MSPVCTALRTRRSGLRAVPLLISLLLTLTAWSGLRGKDKTASTPAIRWQDGNPGCTFDRGEDGKYRYGLWADDLGITMAVDSQELQRTRYRLDPFIGIFLTFRYRGAGSVDIPAANMSLEFVTHSRVSHKAVDPDGFSTAYQDKVDAFADEIEREIKNHPEKKDEKEALLRAYEKEAVEVQEFVTTRGLRPAKLDTATREISGWVFFRTKDKWIGGWKKQEAFVLRVISGNQVFEFPFKLPPSAGDLILRRRQN